jgi:protein Tex
MSYAETFAHDLGLRPAQVAATIELLDAGNTIPFIARYRKERTAGLDEEQLRSISAALESRRALDERRATVLAAIEEQGKLTTELRERLLAVTSRTELEDLYQPYKARRRTRASVARDKGLAGLAELIVAQPRTGQSPAAIAAPFLGAEVPDAAQAWAGARDVVAEQISDHPDVRRLTRERALQWGALQSDRIEKSDDPRGVYQSYYDWGQRIDRVRPHQVLALNRGEAEKVLRVRVAVPDRDWRAAIATAFRPDRRSPLHDQLALSIAGSSKSRPPAGPWRA